jgi:hypothetical protein
MIRIRVSLQFDIETSEAEGAQLRPAEHNQEGSRSNRQDSQGQVRDVIVPSATADIPSAPNWRQMDWRKLEAELLENAPPRNEFAAPGYDTC